MSIQSLLLLLENKQLPSPTNTSSSNHGNECDEDSSKNTVSVVSDIIQENTEEKLSSTNAVFEHFLSHESSDLPNKRAKVDITEIQVYSYVCIVLYIYFC